MITPLVASVMPAHNAEATLLHAARSVFAQKTSLELIVCDDASSDETASILRSIDDARLIHLRNEQNLGPGASRDIAIRRASAPWVAFIDADDVWRPDRMQRLVAAAESTGADVVFDDVLLCHDATGELIPWQRIHGTRAFGGRGNASRLVRIEEYVAAPRLLVQPLVRTAFIREHHVEHSARRFGEDAEFLLRLAHAGAKFCYVPEPLYLYRITPGSLTARVRDRTLMRQCIQACSLWDGWDPAVLAAFRTKIATLERDEALYAFSDHVRTGQLRSALGLLSARPGLCAPLARKALGQLRYQMHRLVHGGRSR